MGTRFECPKCGSDCFGTNNPTDAPERRVRSCHGEDGCRFTWPEADDWKYFIGVVVEEETRPFTSAEDFENFKDGGG